MQPVTATPNSGTPELGVAVTGCILAAAIPLTGVLFFTAVKNSR
jgi:hypothetical protein